MTRAAALLLVLALAACGNDEQRTADPPPPSSPGGDPSPGASETPTGTRTATPQPQPQPNPPPRVVGTVARNLAVPWGVDFLPNGAGVVTERDSGRVLVVRDGRVREIGHIPEDGQLEAGLLGVAVSPDFGSDRQLYFYVTSGEDNRVVRASYDDGRLSTPEPVLTGIPKGAIHDGGRLAFGPDGLLYVSTGEVGDPERAQDRSSLGGKILRITPDGGPAPGNPDPDSPVWSWGHRNVQGLAFDSDGRLWASEFGQQAWDELNLIEKGGNYGWPRHEGEGGEPDFTDPQVVWRTSEASPSGLAHLDGRLWMASLRGQRLWRIGLDGAQAVRPRDFLVGDHGRLRTVAVAPDGMLWVTTSNHDGRGDPRPDDDRILLVDPS